VRQNSSKRLLGIALVFSVLLMVTPARAASLQPVANWGATGVPTYISMFIYVPDRPAANPPILVVGHFCGGSASQVFGQAQGGGLVAAADRYGFIMVFPQTTRQATSAKCWDVGSPQSLTHDGGGDTQAIAQMVKYTVSTYKANANRVYATGDSSGAMLTQALLAVYPDVFKAGASFAGVPAGCWSAGWTAASNWGGTCAGGNDIMTAPQWGALVRGMDPAYSGHRPRVQLFHGDADAIINYKNFGEAVKEWTNVLGLATNPTSTTTGLTLGTHQATRQQWKNSCGYVVLDAFTSLGGDHGPSDTLFNATYVVPFLGLDQTGDVDPEIAACGGGSDAGATGAGGASGDGGTGGSGAGGGVGAGGSGSGGASGTAGQSGSGGATSAGQGGAGGIEGIGGNLGTGGSPAGTDGGSGSSGCACALGESESGKQSGASIAGALALVLLSASRRRRRGGKS
jgi:poly(hydroxyalkanoate) depolymerase family esterase